MSNEEASVASIEGVEAPKASSNMSKPINYDKLIKLFKHPDTVRPAPMLLWPIFSSFKNLH